MNLLGKLIFIVYSFVVIDFIWELEIGFLVGML